MNCPDLGSPIHVMHGVLSLDVGGLERIIVDLAREFRRRGHRVSVLCLERRGMLADAAQAEGATIHALNFQPGRSREKIARATDVLKDCAPDVLHTHTVGAVWHLGPAAWAVGRTPVVHTAHINHFRKEIGALRGLKTRWLYRQAGRYVGRWCGVAEDVTAAAGRWGTIPQSKLATVLNGIDTELYDDKGSRGEARAALGIPPNTRVVGTVGRVVDVKRQDLMIRALRDLGPGFEDVHLLIVGDGVERGNLEALTRELGLSSRVHFTGFQQAPQCFYAAMDAFALSSRIEGLPLAILEAWAAGLPVVSTAVGGVPKLVRPGETGLLVPYDDVPKLAAALRAVLSDGAKARSMAEAGRCLVRQNYSLERMATEYERHYRAVIAENRGTR